MEQLMVEIHSQQRRSMQYLTSLRSYRFQNMQKKSELTCGIKLEELKERYDCITGHRGIALMQGLEFDADHPVGDIVKKALEKGLIIISAGNNVIRFVPPLVIEKEKMERAKEICNDGSILEIRPLQPKKAAILTTGSEVYHGRIQDKFTPVLVEKLKEYGSEVIFHEIYDDDHEAITKGCLSAIEQGAEIVLCTGGMSVDPDDKTPLAIKNTGARIVSYGAPVLPGAMFLVSYYEYKDKTIPIVGLPGCVMYAKRTIFDLVLPRVMADDKVTAEELAALGPGGLCLNCPVCTFPNCGFGKECNINGIYTF